MAFCKYCGNQIPDGRLCSCPQAQAEAAALRASAPQAPVPQAPVPQAPVPQAPVPQAPVPQAPVPQAPVPQAPVPQAPVPQAPVPQAPSAASTAFNSMGAFFRMYFKDPSEAVRSSVQSNNIILAVILAVTRGLAMGLAMFGILNKFCTSLTDVSSGIFSILGGLVSSSGLGSLGKYVSIKAPFFGCLLWGFIIAAVGMILYIVAIFLLCKIMGGSSTFGMVFQANTDNGVVTTALLLLAFIASFISILASVFFLFLAALASAAFGVMTAQMVCPNANTFKFWALYLAMMTAVLLVNFIIVPLCILPMFNGITVTVAGRSVTIGDAFKSGFSRYF